MITIRRIGVLSTAKVMGILYALLGLIFGALFTCISLFGALAVNSAFGGEAGGFESLFGMAAIIIAPIFYGVLGFIGGAIMAALYNLVAGWVGGIELETQ